MLYHSWLRSWLGETKINGSGHKDLLRDMEVSPRGLFCFILKPKLGQIPVVSWKCFLTALICLFLFFLSAARFSSLQSHLSPQQEVKLPMRGPSSLGKKTVAAVLCILFWAEECVRALLSVGVGLATSPQER